ncbi:MAG: PcfJ domain-containing protein [Lachnospiraceae bacterium]|nr:PcfJ domain-containing protein [Lachnospiraceae bacterium]
MRKEELRKLKRIYATPKMMQMAGDNHKKTEYSATWNKDYKRVYNTEFDLFVRCQTRKSFLMICVFKPEWMESGIKHPLYEIYCNREGDEWITRIMNRDGTEEKWSSAMFDNLLYVRNSHWDIYGMPDTKKRIWQNPEGRNTIRDFLKTKEKGVEGLIDWQRKIKVKRIEEAEKRQQAPWNADMKLVPKIMPSFAGWMQREAADQYFIIYEYEAKKDQKEGWCSGCRRYVHITQPRHNKRGKCPCCGKDVIFKASGKIKSLATGIYIAQCIQKIHGGIVVRTFHQKQYYSGVTDYRKPDCYTDEAERILIMNDGKVKRYYYGNYKNKYSRFILDRYSSWYFSSEIKLYPGNLGTLKKTALKNSAIDLWPRYSREKKLPIDAAHYLAIERNDPVIEKLAKIGMFTLAKDLIRGANTGDGDILDHDATELAKMLKIDGARLKRLKVMDGRCDHLKWFQSEKRRDLKWPDAMIKDFADDEIEDEDFGFLCGYRISYVKIWNYMKRQQVLMQGSLTQVMRTWEDYINMAEKAKMDIKNERIWKPKDLKAAHNEVIMILQQGEMEKEAKKLEKKWPKVNGILPKLKKFEYASKDFAVLAPESILDIVKEGRILQHCVHTCDFYFDRIQRDETYLFFLRRAGQEDVPWYTLEVEAGGNIRQKRTTGDNQNKDFEEAVAFLKKWQRYFIKQLTKEEKAAGKLADQARQQEYAKLRQDGNRVWHGKLAGQLLADVLEADFMAVEEFIPAEALAPAT